MYYTVYLTLLLTHQNLNYNANIAANSANQGFAASSKGFGVLATELDKRYNTPTQTANEGSTGVS